MLLDGMLGRKEGRKAEETRKKVGKGRAAWAVWGNEDERGEQRGYTVIL